MQFERAGRHDRLPGFQPGDHDHKIAPASPQPHKLLPDHLGGHAGGRVFFLLDDEDRVAIRGVEHRGGGDHEQVLDVWQDDRDIGKHAGAEPLIVVGQGGLHPDVAG